MSGARQPRGPMWRAAVQPPDHKSPLAPKRFQAVKERGASDGDWPRRQKSGREALMSNELLKRVGESVYGQQWQAPLARDLGVNERSMRRWVAGTDEIPRGVW